MPDGARFISDQHRKILSGLMAAAFMALFACNEKPEYESGPRRMEAAEPARDSGPPSWESVVPYEYHEKSLALADYRRHLRKLDAKIAHLEGLVLSAGPEINHNVKEGHKEDLENLRLRREKLMSAYSALEETTGRDWEKNRRFFVENWNDLRSRWEGKARAE